VLAILLLVIAGPLYQLGLLPLALAFGLLRWAAYVGVVALIVNLAAAAFAYRRGERAHAAIGAVAVLLAVIAVAVPFRWQRAAQAAPRIHDISTDLQNPPTFKAIVPLREGAPNGLERPPIVNDLQRKGYPDIQPITLPIPPDQVFEEVIERIQDDEWEIVDANKEGGTVEAIATTAWFGFKDDVVVRLTPWGSGTRVDMRSVSRVGLSDIGTNARRVREFLDELKRGT
jgi:uncharacterized protein (DUF1499 family)